jgi:hypothetical protein
MGSKAGIFIAFDRQGRVAFHQICTDPDGRSSWLPARVWPRLRARYAW